MDQCTPQSTEIVNQSDDYTKIIQRIKDSPLHNLPSFRSQTKANSPSILPEWNTDPSLSLSQNQE